MDESRKQVLASMEEQDAREIQFELGLHFVACMTKAVSEEQVGEC